MGMFWMGSMKCHLLISLVARYRIVVILLIIITTNLLERNASDFVVSETSDSIDIPRSETLSLDEDCVKEW